MQRLDRLERLMLTRFDRSDAELHTILLAIGKVIDMSETVSQQIDAAAARDEAATAKLSADLAAIAAELKATQPDPGSVVTQAQADRHNAIATALEAAAAAADALVVPATPAAPAV